MKKVYTVRRQDRFGSFQWARFYSEERASETAREWRLLPCTAHVDTHSMPAEWLLAEYLPEEGS